MKKIWGFFVVTVCLMSSLQAGQFAVHGNYSAAGVYALKMDFFSLPTGGQSENFGRLFAGFDFVFNDKKWDGFRFSFSAYPTNEIKNQTASGSKFFTNLSATDIIQVSGGPLNLNYIFPVSSDHFFSLGLSMYNLSFSPKNNPNSMQGTFMSGMMLSFGSIPKDHWYWETQYFFDGGFTINIFSSNTTSAYMYSAINTKIGYKF
jgi:hypothetical protein